MHLFKDKHIGIQPYGSLEQLVEILFVVVPKLEDSNVS